ncbi:MAG: hypothetical protein ACRC33_15175 [Gemmataceae bacterium]
MGKRKLPSPFLEVYDVKSLVALAVALGLVGLVGCGPNSAPRDTTVVDVTATVTGPNGKPLPKTLVVILQPSGDTLGAKLVATEDGKFSGKATPGKYVYFVQMAKSDIPPKGIPVKYTEPSAANIVDVSAGQPLTITLTP